LIPALFKRPSPSTCFRRSHDAAGGRAPVSAISQEKLMTTTVLGYNYIGGQRSARGDVTLHSLSASTGETYPVAFAQATDE
jgi:hypothetical protein